MNYKKCTILTETETRTRGNTVSRPDPADVLKEVRKEIKHNAVIVEDPPAFRRGHSLGIKTAVAIIDAKIKELEG